jgi:hypothetical protein
LILSKVTSSRDAVDKIFHVFKIFDFVEQEIVYESNLYNPELVGRLKSGLYTFVKGHIYYSNNVIKIRYDLLNAKSNAMLKEDEIFDYYFDCFVLQENQKVKADTPLDSMEGHRFGYVISDQS